MDPRIKQKLKELKEYYYDDDFSLKWIEEVEKNIRRLLAMEKLATNKSIKAIVKDAQARIKTINTLLTMDEDLSTEDRKMLYRERNVHQFYLDRFEGQTIEERFEKIGNVLGEEVQKITGVPDEK